MHPTQTDLSKINTRQLFQLTIDAAHTFDFCEEVNLIKKEKQYISCGYLYRRKNCEKKQK